ncbi:tau-tubulin kinase 1-like [Cyclopterus lumpus]|uniref:tau-tubulin kinase 1-like n=1 Tax=Cyclopterus lumpus TaxID=8103 RepID=UPI001486370D|nr:tau-tubulin kinase 1-like [Cyclopterus lumpus]
MPDGKDGENAKEQENSEEEEEEERERESQMEVRSTDVEERTITPAPSSGAVIGGILGSLAFIGIIVCIVFYIRKRQEDGEGPPKHKPPPPVKAGSSTEMLNKPSEPPTATETAPLSPGEVYYEPTGGEPVTNLDDETTGALNGGAPPVLGHSAKVNELAADGHRGNDLDLSNHEQPVTNISRGESFVSPAMYV